MDNAENDIHHNNKHPLTISDSSEYDLFFGASPSSSRSGEKDGCSCPICGKEFSQKGNVRAHMLLHTGEKPFRCEVCGKQFTQKGNKKAHVLTHYKWHSSPATVVTRCINLYGQLHQYSVNCEHRLSQFKLYWCSWPYRFIHRGLPTNSIKVACVYKDDVRRNV